MKTLFGGSIVEIKPRINFEEDNDGVAVVRSISGKRIGEARIYGWNVEKPYIRNPLYFIQLPELSAEQRFCLIKQFEEWYGDLDIMPSCWALEFELVTRMLCYETCALIINPRFLEMSTDMYETIRKVIWPSVSWPMEEKNILRKL